MDRQLGTIRIRSEYRKNPRSNTVFQRTEMSSTKRQWRRCKFIWKICRNNACKMLNMLQIYSDILQYLISHACQTSYYLIIIKNRVTSGQIIDIYSIVTLSLYLWVKWTPTTLQKATASDTWRKYSVLMRLLQLKGSVAKARKFFNKAEVKWH
jgi:hypothetical protein